MRTVFSVAMELRKKLGCLGIVVDAKPGAANYYSRYGFVELEATEDRLEERPTPKPMFLPVTTIVQALKAAQPKKSD